MCTYELFVALLSSLTRWHLGRRLQGCRHDRLVLLQCRDLKSSNVLLAADGSTAKLADFGSAMLVGAAGLT